MDPPTTAPVKKAVTADSITVKAVDGLEYSLNQQDWQPSGVFDGLEPNTEYSVYVRTAAKDNNHAPSNPFGLALTVRTTDATSKKVEISGALPISRQPQSLISNHSQSFSVSVWLSVVAPALIVFNHPAC